MKYRILGHSDLKISEISLGNWLTAGSYLDSSVAKDCVFTAIDAGINFLDTADVYTGAENVLGEILSHLNRQKLIIGTKCFFPTSENALDRGLSRRHIFNSVENSLKKLRIETIDLMQCHRFDLQTPLEETVTAMGDLIQEGKIRYWGISRWNTQQTQAAIEIARQKKIPAPIANQYFYNLLNRDIEAGLLDDSQKMGVGILAYSPLAQGVLTGKYLRTEIPANSRAAQAGLRRTMWDLQPEKLKRVEKLKAIAEQNGFTLLQMALAWCLRKQNITSVIIGATHPNQIRENLTALEKTLSPQIDLAIEECLAS